MARMKYTQEQLDFLEQGYKKMKVTELVKAFNEEFGTSCGFKQIRSTLSNHGFRAGRRPGYRGGGWNTVFSVEELAFLEVNAHLKMEDLVQLFNKRFEADRSYDSIQTKVRKMGLVKYPQRRRKVSDEFSYHENGYLMVKAKDGGRNYRYKHVVVWEEANGPVPKGHVIRFLDGNQQNCSLENLELFTRAESSHLNMMRFNDAPDELRETIILTARLKAKMSRRRKELETQS